MEKDLSDKRTEETNDFESLMEQSLQRAPRQVMCSPARFS